MKFFLFLFFIFSPSLVFAQGGIVSLKPNMTEIVFALGLGDKVVGDTTYCDYPEKAKKITKVADYVHVDVEKVMALAPDLVLNSIENNNKKEVNFLQEQGLKVSLYPFGRLSDVMQSIKSLGRDLGVADQGENLVKELQSGLEALKNKLQPRANEKVLMIVGVRPLVVVGGNNFLDDVLQYLQLDNVARDSRLRYPNYSVEQMIKSAPTVIIDMTMGSEKNDAQRSLEWYQQYSSIPAVKNGRVYFLDMGDFRASPRLVDGVKKLVEALNH